jgi:hypothetical protein
MCCAVSALWGFLIQHSNPDGMLDLKGAYYSARCLLHHGDPYKFGEPLRVCQSEGGDCRMPSDVLRQVMSLVVYLPTVFVVTVPVALLSWSYLHLLWLLVSAGNLLFAAFLIWDLARNDSPIISTLLICFVLANCEAVCATGNPAGIAVALAVIAVWCLLQERYVPAGILCFAVSLVIKPHDAGLIWLCFLLAGASYRKRALQILALAVVLGLPGILWVGHIAPHWMQELHSNLLADAAPGGACDPGPSNPNTGSGPSAIIDLQSTIALVWNDPRIYNPITYLICGALLTVGAIRMLGSKLTQASAWLALASVVPLTVLVSYHRPYDAKLLLLAIPACVALWTERGLVGWIALLLTTAGIVSTADIPLTLLLILNRNLHISTTEIYGKIYTAVLQRPTPLILLAMSIFYLWAFMRFSRHPKLIDGAIRNA